VNALSGVVAKPSLAHNQHWMSVKVALSLMNIWHHALKSSPRRGGDLFMEVKWNASTSSIFTVTSINCTTQRRQRSKAQCYGLLIDADLKEKANRMIINASYHVYIASALLRPRFTSYHRIQNLSPDLG
jgi:hypothetical protein